MAIDLGGIAKGYAVDRALRVLKAAGVSSSLVDAGGDIGLLGSKPNGAPWRIGVQHPRDMREMIAVIEIDSGSVATSGDYERFFEHEGRHYHHILDPRSGYPARGLVSVTIIAPTCGLADALSTAVFVLGPEAGMQLLRRLPQAEGLLIAEKEGKLTAWKSKGFPTLLETEGKDDLEIQEIE